MKPSQNGRGKGLESTTPNKNKKAKQNKTLYIHIGMEKNVKENKTLVKAEEFSEVFAEVTKASNSKINTSSPCIHGFIIN